MDVRHGTPEDADVDSPSQRGQPLGETFVAEDCLRQLQAVNRPVQCLQRLAATYRFHAGDGIDFLRRAFAQTIERLQAADRVRRPP